MCRKAPPMRRSQSDPRSEICTDSRYEQKIIHAVVCFVWNGACGSAGLSKLPQRLPTEAGGFMMRRVFFFPGSTADPRRSLESAFQTPTPRLEHRLASFFLLNSRQEPELQEGSFLITIRAPRDENSFSSKRSESSFRGNLEPNYTGDLPRMYRARLPVR